MPTKIHDLLQKLANLASCPSAPKGESETALIKMVTIAKKNHIDMAVVLDLLKKGAELKSILSRSRRKQRPPRIFLSAMPSGQYRGKTFEEIFRIDPDFFIWVLRAPQTKEKIKSGIQEFLKNKYRTNP